MIKVCPTCGGPVEAKLISTKPATPLSPREIESLEAYAKWGTSKLVAHELGISVQTVKNHLLSARHKMNADTSMQLILKYFGVPYE